MTGPSATDRPRPWFARFYAWMSPRVEEQGMGGLREDLLSGLSGRVVEVGAGNGLNFRRYPTAVTEVVAVEPEPYLRSLAREAAVEAEVAVTVVAGTAGRLPLPDASVDAAVLSLVLCSVPDQGAALAEVHRVVRPGGVLHFLEHVAADTSVLRAVQRLADATVWPRLAGGCHTARDSVDAIRRAGFDVVSDRRFRFPPGPVAVPAAPHALGTALRP